MTQIERMDSMVKSRGHGHI
jgi:hypothetical protein